ncbi:hypothetical protein GCM10027275_51770 [Rhabdobacter roseus]|uniref:Uncharacterized protein n=1 Tax=Rhabdobacter roseus TaxID=1655419 RepID=A0A840U031_9BACT|nr:hypothetical protein [Rhabdobacter roseus]MBB5287252.1 hypothetical protein [Rhabdobacter roseus]
MFIEQYSKSLKYCKAKLGITLNYLNSFEESGIDAKKALLSLMNKDLINYETIKKSLEISNTLLSTINLNIQNQDTLATKFSENIDLINETMLNLDLVSRFKGSELEFILDRKDSQLIALKKNITLEKIDSIRNEYDVEIREKYYNLIINYFPEISEELSKLAGREIYKKLVHANIDLGKSGAKNGEVLNLYVTWKIDSKINVNQNPPRLSLGKYYLKDTGWKLEIADMFSLVKRINEPTSTEDTLLSPSNFKGTGGAVLMWTFNSLDRGIKLVDRNGTEKIIRKNRFINFVEPSIGINISYLDFSTGKDVEIGTGIQAGLFRNKIYFGYGANLHLLRPRDQNPYYFFLGFSFTKLSDFFKDSKSVASQ